MGDTIWREAENLILVAGHAVYIASDFVDPTSDNSWFLQDFQRGEPRFYVEHISRGVTLAEADPRSLLVFSGGQTRRGAGPRSEGLSYWLIANHFGWWGNSNARHRTTTEEFARDSFENLLFGICRFREAIGRYPQRVTVVGWTFKKNRFDLHRKAIRFPESGFVFEGVNNPVDVAKAEQGEAKAVADFDADPYGNRESRGETENGRFVKYLGDKRKDRNPFGRQHGYRTSCLELTELLDYRGLDPFSGVLPW